MYDEASVTCSTYCFEVRMPFASYCIHSALYALLAVALDSVISVSRFPVQYRFDASFQFFGFPEAS